MIVKSKRIKRISAVIMAFAIIIASFVQWGSLKNVKAAEKYSLIEKEYKGSYSVDKGYYYIPTNVSGTIPAVIFIHGQGKIKKDIYKRQVEKFINSGYISPFVLIMPNLDGVGHNAYVCKDQDTPLHEEWLGRVIKRMDKGEFDTDNVKIDKLNGYSISGYSMGGSAAILAGIAYNEKFINVGGFSPSVQLHYPAWNISWIMDSTETQSCTFTSDPKRHLVFSSGSSKNENTGEAEDGHLECVGRCLKLFGDDNGFAQVVFDYNKHDSYLFSQEFFNFLYYIQHDEFPSDEIIQEVFKEDTNYAGGTYPGPISRKRIILPTTATPTAKPTAAPTAKPTATPTNKPTAAPSATPVKALTGKVDIVGEAVCGKILCASINGCNAKVDDLIYQWKRDGIAISNANNGNYVLQKEDIGTIISCDVTDKSGKHPGTITGKTSQKIAPAPTAKPTDKPTAAPTAKPTAAPTEKPTDAPTDQPTETPTQVPSEVPTSQPTDSPTDTPVAQPTETPIELPIIPIGPRPKSEVTPTKQPNVTPTNKPSEDQAEEQKTEDASKVKEGALLQFEKTGNEYKITKVITKDGKLIGGNVTYMRCTNKDVKKVIIPAYIKINGVRFNVTKINKKAFKGCSKLRKIIIKTKKLTKIGSKAFSGIHKKAKIKVPKSKYKKYKKMIRKAKTPKKVKITK